MHVFIFQGPKWEKFKDLPSLLFGVSLFTSSACSFFTNYWSKKFEYIRFVNSSILKYSKIHYLDDCNGGNWVKKRHLSLLPLNRKIDEKSDFIPFWYNISFHFMKPIKCPLVFENIEIHSTWDWIKLRLKLRSQLEIYSRIWNFIWMEVDAVISFTFSKSNIYILMHSQRLRVGSTSQVKDRYFM